MSEVHQLPVGQVLPIAWDSLDILALILLPVAAMQYQTPFWSEITVVEFTLLSSTPLPTSHKLKPNCKNTCGQANLFLMQRKINQCCCTTSASLIHYLCDYKQQFFRLSQSCCHGPFLGMQQWHWRLLCASELPAGLCYEPCNILQSSSLCSCLAETKWWGDRVMWNRWLGAGGGHTCMTSDKLLV